MKAAGERLSQPVGGMVHPQGGAQAQRSQKSIGEQFVASAAYKGFNGRQSPTAQLDDVDFKTLMTHHGRLGADPDA